MNWLDIAILVWLELAAFLGYRWGLLASMLSFIGVMVALVLAGRYYWGLAGVFSSSQQGAKAVAFILIIMATLAASAIVASVFGWRLSWTPSGWGNRLGGIIVEILVGTFLMGALFIVAIKFSVFNLEGSIASSTMARALGQLFFLILGFLPEEFEAVLGFFQ